MFALCFNLAREENETKEKTIGYIIMPYYFQANIRINDEEEYSIY